MNTSLVLKEEADQILSLEENHFRDMKAKDIAPAKLTQSVSAFANAAGAFYDTGASTTSVGNLTADPLFVDAAAADFHVHPSSPAVGAGSCLADVPVDLEGTSRAPGQSCDIGAYEH